MLTQTNSPNNPRAHKNALKLKTAQNYVEERERIDISLGAQIHKNIDINFANEIIIFFNRVMQKTREDVFNIVAKASFEESDNINNEKWDRLEIEGVAQGMLEMKNLSDFYIMASSTSNAFYQTIQTINRNQEKSDALYKEHYLKLASFARTLEQKIDCIDFLHLELDLLWKWQLETYPSEMENINDCYSHLCRMLIIMNRFIVTGNDFEETTKGGAHA